jgi:hypothetical protein
MLTVQDKISGVIGKTGVIAHEMSCWGSMRMGKLPHQVFSLMSSGDPQPVRIDLLTNYFSSVTRRLPDGSQFYPD